MSDFEYSYSDNVYATHQPYLEAYVRATSGDILEFGTGIGSTALIRKCIEGTKRRLISIEDNLEWYNKMITDVPPNEQHTYIYLEKKEEDVHWEEFLNSFNHPSTPSVVFIDQSPWSARLKTIDKFYPIAEYIILHDADYYPASNSFGRITDPSLPFTDESKYDFSKELAKYKLYFPPPPWHEYNHGPPTLVATSKQLPIIPWHDINYE